MADHLTLRAAFDIVVSRKKSFSAYLIVADQTSREALLVYCAILVTEGAVLLRLLDELDWFGNTGL